MDDKKLTKIIRDYFGKVLHLSLATSVNDRPWVCELHFVFDQSLDLYFISKPSRRHSLEIGQNPMVSGNIVEQHTINDKVRGIYFEGRAHEITAIDISSPIYLLFKERLRITQDTLEEQNLPDGHRFYKIEISDYYVFDGRESNPGKKYHLVSKNNSNKFIKNTLNSLEEFKNGKFNTYESVEDLIVKT